MWIELCGSLCWWLIDLYAGRLQCKKVLNILKLWCAGSIAINPILGEFEGIFHVSIVTCVQSYVFYYVGNMLAYMLADFSANGCVKYQLLWCAGSISTNPILSDFEGIFHVSIATSGLSHVIYYVGAILAYMLVEFSANGCLKYQYPGVQVHSHRPKFRWLWGYILCIQSHMWIEPCLLLSWWDVSLHTSVQKGAHNTHYFGVQGP